MTTPNMPELPPSPASPPSAWVERFLTGVAAGGRALDVACGQGRHLRLALALGLSVTGIDRTLAGVADLRGEPRARLIAADLESGGAFPVGEERAETGDGAPVVLVVAVDAEPQVARLDLRFEAALRFSTGRAVC